MVRRGGLGNRAVHASRRLLRLLARPARSVASEGGVVLQAYRGYGSAAEVFLIGRVYREPPWLSGARRRRHKRAWDDLGRLLFRRGIGGAVVRASFGGAEAVATTDRDGYFRVHLRPAAPLPGLRAWQRMRLELQAPVRLAVHGEVFVPPAGGRQVVISDIDDTILETGVADKLAMLWRLFMEGTDHRPAIPGVAALLGALHRGAGGAEHNPLLYVSRAPWTLYEVLDRFFRAQRVPGGPLLFLREWGLRLWRPFPRRGRDHKLVLIRHMMALYRDLPVVLIGDSVQDDPELYCQIVREHPGRVRAIYIRNISRHPARLRAIEALAGQVAAAGSSLLLAPDCGAMAAHAAAHGLIAPSAGAAAAAAAEPSPPPRRVEPAGVAAALEAAPAGEPAPQVLVEPRGRGA